MWLMTKIGFFSVVAHRDDSETMLVRARVRGDLEALQGLWGKLDYPDLAGLGMTPSEIIDTPDADYAHRIFMPKWIWVILAEKLAEGIDYPNFKAAVHGNWRRDQAYFRIWQEMKLLQNYHIRPWIKVEDGD